MPRRAATRTSADPPPDGVGARATLLALALITLLGLGLRLAHVATTVQAQDELEEPGMDRWVQREVARAVAEGDLLGGPLSAYESSPTYAIVLGLLYRACGRSWLGPLLVQALLGALVAPLLFSAGARLASVRVGLIAALFAAAYGPAVFYEGLTIKFALVPFTMAALLAGLSGTSLWAACAAGLAMACLVALRANAVFVVPVALAWILGTRERSVAPRAALVFGTALLLTAAPIALRRSLAAEESEQASLWGIHIYIGTQLDGQGGYAVIPGIDDDVFGHVDDARTVAETAAGHALTPSEVSRYWFARSVAVVREHPLGYVKLLGRKMRRLVAPGEEGSFGDEPAAYVARSAVLGAGLLGFGALAPFAAVGSVLAVWGRSRLAWCVALSAVYAVTLLVFFVEGRYRLPLVPPAMLLGAGTVSWLADLWAAGRHAWTGALVLVLLAIGAGLGAPSAALGQTLAIVVIGVPLCSCLGAARPSRLPGR